MTLRYTTYRNENGGEVEAHYVTDATEGNYNTVAGPRKALVGDVLVKQQNGYYHEVVDRKGFEEVYHEPTDEELEDTNNDPFVGIAPQPRFDPNQETAATVADYLRRVTDRKEYERVTAAEKDGRNRSSAFVDRSWQE